MRRARINGFGLGLRAEHYQDVLESAPAVDWFEVLTENYLVPGGKPLYFLDRVAERYPLVMHGVAMSLGGTDTLDFDYLRQVKELCRRINAGWISDHLCWTGGDGVYAHDLFPLPYTEEALQHVVARIAQVQEFLGQRLLLENVSSYVAFADSDMSEWDFVAEVAKQADCDLLLDVNNVYVSAYNHCFDACSYIDGLPRERIKQIHLAGHSHNGNHIVDTHDAPVAAEVWQLYDYACRRLGRVPTMIERDANIPALDDLVTELQRAREIASDASAIVGAVA
jgi:uncharacterized protein (UPF0276 family)